jgi:hypothetical protein
MKSSIRRGAQVPAEAEGDETVTRVDVAELERTVELEALVEEGAAELAAELERTEDETGAELERTLEGTAELERMLDGATELERTLDGAAELTPGEPPQPKTMLLSCHVTVVEEKPDQTNPVTAFPLAPVNEDRGTVTVCVLPVRPVTWKYLEV